MTKVDPNAAPGAPVNLKLAEILIEDPGLGYAYDDKYRISVSASEVPETMAKLYPVIYNGGVHEVVIENAGKGYADAQIAVIGDNNSGTPARIMAYISTSDLSSDQATIEQTAVPGEIYSIVVTNPGSDYSTSNPPVVTITGDGTGAVATAVVVNGQVTQIKMTDNMYGSNYTYATVNIASAGVANSIQATARVNIAPIGGHGYDAVAELLADTVCLYSNIRYASATENSFSQDFREYGIIKNLRDAFTGNLSDLQYQLLAYPVSLTSDLSPEIDELLSIGDMKFRVLSSTLIGVSPTQYAKVYLLPVTSVDFAKLVPNALLTADAETSRVYRISDVTYPFSVDKYTGQMLFVSDSDAFTFTNEQEITIKTFLTL